MIEQIKSFANRYGWGSVISATPYANGLLVITAGLLCYFLYVIFSLFGIYPAPPQESLNPISWILYLLFQIVLGWFMWSYMTSSILFLLGAAWSLSDLLAAYKTNDDERRRGAIAGLCLTVVPILLWFKSSDGGRGSEYLSMAGAMLHHTF